MSKVYAINCPNCAAPLSILGGGRVSTITCSYCHSVLDMNDHYKVLSQFSEVKQPTGDFRIGMKGNIKGVEWTIIGWVYYKTAEFPSEEWSEFFLYSPTHGYAWLFEENGKLYLSLRVRDFDILSWNQQHPKTIFYHKGHYLQKEPSYLSYIEYVEGELTYIAKFGDKFTTWDYSGVGFKTLSIEKSGDEIEAYHSIPLQKDDIYSSFGMEYNLTTKNIKDVQNKSFDRIQDEYSYKLEEERSSNKRWFVILFMLMAFMSLVSFISPKTVLEDSYLKDLNRTFYIDSDSFLTTIDISFDEQKDYNHHKIWIYHNGKKIFYIDQNKVFFDKKPMIYSWDFDATGASIYLKLDKGEYRIVAKKDNSKVATKIVVKQRVIRLKYLIPLMIFFALFIAYDYLSWIDGKVVKIATIIAGGVIIYLTLGLEALVIIGAFIYYIVSGYNRYKESKGEL